MSDALSDYRQAKHSTTGFSPLKLTYNASKREFVAARRNIIHSISVRQARQRRVRVPQDGELVQVKSPIPVHKGHWPENRVVKVQSLESPQVIRTSDNETISISRIAPTGVQKSYNGNMVDAGQRQSLHQRVSTMSLRSKEGRKKT